MSTSSINTIAILSLLSLLCQHTYAQLGFCNGNSGDPIFVEDFGTGTTNGPALASGTTTYNYTSFSPSDGNYTIASTSNYFDWHVVNDHTPNDTNGKMFIVNASFTAGEFYRKTITGLCENTSYEFSSWLINLLPRSGCGGAGIPINVTFQIWDSTNTNMLASGSTGNIQGEATPSWNNYGLVFQTLATQTSVILKMINNSEGGCGNDLAIDDIAFKSCGDFITLTDDTGENIIAQCEEDGVIVSTTITATPDFSIYTTHAYQWQVSADAINWTDISGETTNMYTTPTLSESRFFRVKVAEDPLNVSNDLCNVVSEVFNAILVPIPDPPVSNGDLAVCANSLLPLTVSVPPNHKVNWYDAPTGGNLLMENSTSFTPSASGTFYAAASSTLVDCFSRTRTPLGYTIYSLPVEADENRTLCENVPIMLTTEETYTSYRWNTGETTKSITVGEPGMYTVTVTNENNCSATKTITVEQIDQPVIETIVSVNEDIVVTAENSDTNAYEYALNDGAFQDSPVFELVEGGIHQIHVRGKNDCPVVSEEFHHFVIPKFFTPNGDTINDRYILQGLEFFNQVEVQIYNRYGKLLMQSKNLSFSWDGTYNGKILPSSDYWYYVKADSLQFTGHFTLKR